MFEKEAEENANQFIKTHSESDKFINCKRETDNYNVILAQGYELGFQKGAEFGYNKANEWHYVKDGDLPKENQLVMVYRVNPLGANIAITNWYDSYKDTKVIAWKEIVLPKEIE